MRQLFIGIFVIMLISNGCKPFIKLRYGIKDPKVETPESLLTFIRKFNVDSNTIYVFRDTVSYFQSMRDSIFKKNGIGTLLFDRNGFLIDNSKNCQWSGGAFINQFIKDSVYTADSAYLLKDLLQNIIPLVAEKKVDDSSIYDLTAISIWAKFIGKYNDRLFFVSEAAKTRKDLKIKVIYLNIDMLEAWNLKKNQMLQ